MIQWPLLRKELGRLAVRYLLAGAAAMAVWAFLAWAPLGIEPQTVGKIMMGGLKAFFLVVLYLYFRPVREIYRSAGPANAGVFGALGAGMLWGIYVVFLGLVFLAYGIFGNGK